MNAIKPDFKIVSTSYDFVINKGITRVQIATDKTRKFCTGFALILDQLNDPNAFYRVGLLSGDGTVLINRVPAWFFAKDFTKLKKEEIYFPIDAPANGSFLFAEIERFSTDSVSTLPLKIDFLVATSNTQNTETFVLQHELILPASGLVNGVAASVYGLNII